MKFKLILLFFGSLVFSFLFLGAIFLVVASVKNVDNNSHQVEDVSDSSKFQQVINKHDSFIRCSILEIKGSSSQSECISGKAREEGESVVSIIKNQLSSNFLINVIYGILLVCLWSQTFLFFLSLMQMGKIGRIHFYLSEWAINSPPLLGVLGTIASFAILVNHSDPDVIKKLFSSAFFDAAITTLIGGFVYVLNLAMAIRLNAYVED